MSSDGHSSPAAYQSVGQTEEQHQRRPTLRLDADAGLLTQLLQCVCLAGLVTAGVALLTARAIGRSAHLGPEPVLGSPNSSAVLMKAVPLPSFGGSSDFMLRSRHKATKRHHARAASGKSVILVGSHFELGNSLLTELFGYLCPKSRLGLRCEPVWGAKHDLKSLASYKGRKRLVWLERESPSFLDTLRGVGKYASNVLVVHLLWDPLAACAAQWPSTLSSNISLAELCLGLRMEEVSQLYRRAKREKGRVLQLRLDELVSKKTGPALWRQTFKFLQLQEKGGDLSALAANIVNKLELRGRVHNRVAPGWVRAQLTQNATLTAYLKKIRRELEFQSLKPDKTLPMR